MGIYLSTPSTEVELEEGTGERVRFVVGEMQGWRKSMEDAHIALADIKNNGSGSSPKFSLFAVFDGHGGKEVAKFAKMQYPKLVLEQLVANEGDVAMALRESFHRVDELLEDMQYSNMLRELRSLPNPCDKAPPRKPLGNSGGTLEDSDSDGEDDAAPGAHHIKGANHRNNHNNSTTPSGLIEDSNTGADQITTSDAVRMIRDMLRKAAARGREEEEEVEMGNGGLAATGMVLTEEGEEGAKDCDNKMDTDEADDIQDLLMEALTSASAPIRGSTSKSAEDKRSSGDAKNGSKHSHSSCGLTVTMHESSDDDIAECKTTDANGNSRHAAINGTILSVPEDKDSAEEDSTADISPKPHHNSVEGDISPGADILPPVPTIASALRAVPPGADVSPVQASRKTPDGVACNLKPHRIMAGCTAVVAMHVGDQLFVANAGDSRGVLCRKNGNAYALSYDHKPQSDTEMNRITAAGGFVNAVGRINGNLNLSRSLGDLKYKQVVQCSREEQIITAEPDITLTQLQEGDRFFILACDGIWDCLTNQQACDFVTKRLDQGMDCAAITKDVLHFCLAPDTASAAGIGCDNMTFMLVLLNQ